MDSPSDNNNSAESLRFESLSKRVFFAARDGLAITLYALLSEQSREQQAALLSQVFIGLSYHVVVHSLETSSISHSWNFAKFLEFCYHMSCLRVKNFPKKNSMTFHITIQLNYTEQKRLLTKYVSPTNLPTPPLIQCS